MNRFSTVSRVTIISTVLLLSSVHDALAKPTIRDAAVEIVEIVRQAIESNSDCSPQAKQILGACGAVGIYALFNGAVAACKLVLHKDISPLVAMGAGVGAAIKTKNPLVGIGVTTTVYAADALGGWLQGVKNRKKESNNSAAARNLGALAAGAIVGYGLNKKLGGGAGGGTSYPVEMERT